MTLDALDFLEAVRGLPEQLAAAHESAAMIDPSRLPSAEGVTNIVICGMGGSGISGDVLAAFDLDIGAVDRVDLLVTHDERLAQIVRANDDAVTAKLFAELDIGFSSG